MILLHKAKEEGGSAHIRRGQGGDVATLPLKAVAGTSIGRRIKRYWPFYLFILPGIAYFAIFRYWPIYGIRIAFYDFGYFGIKQFIGLQNFRELFNSVYFARAFRNTIIISGGQAFLGLSAAIVLSLLLNEVRSMRVKRTVQTIVYLPHFLSWVIVASIFTMLLSPRTGFVNNIIKAVGGKPVRFLTSEAWWRAVYFLCVLWKDTGWGTVVFLAALSGVDPQLYESAWIDGAGRLQQTWYITLPTMAPIIVIVAMLHLAQFFNLFQSVFVLYNPLVYEVSDVLGTLVYRKGLRGGDFDFATAVGLFRSLISLVLVLFVNWLSKRIRGESVL
jgi:putative aldouronate transport system permease protein